MKTAVEIRRRHVKFRSRIVNKTEETIKNRISKFVFETKIVENRKNYIRF